MDATFLSLIRGIEWDKLTAAEAVELRTALRDAVSKSEKWFAALAEGFNAKRGTVEATDRPHKPEATGSSPVPAISTPKVKFRHRGKKKPEPKPKRPPFTPPAASGEEPEEHPPVLLAREMYVSTTGPDPDRVAALPLGHPRRAGGGFDASTIDPDFAAASRKTPEFN